MIKKDTRIDAKGRTRTQIRVVEGYRAGPGLPTKQRTIRDFGCLEDQEDQDSFMAMVREFNKTFRERNAPLRIEAESTALMYSEGNRRQNYGYKYLESVYDLLRVGQFIECHLATKRFRGRYPVADIFKFLVLTRILAPDSKRASFQMKNGFYGMDTCFDLENVYRALGQIAGFEIGLQRHINEEIKEKIGRDLSHAFYDVTNYYFEIDFPDGENDLRQRGVSKEHRVDPIAAMGLFIDGNGIPVSMSVFPGNTSETLTLRPTMRDIKESYGLDRLIVVADKGLNSSKNIDAVVNAGDGFVFSQIIRGTKGQRYHGALFDDEGWVTNADGSYWHKLIVEEYKGKDKDGRAVTRKRQALLYWSEAEADMARLKRDEKLKKAAKSVKNNAYGIKKGFEEYTREDIVDKSTGEVLDDIVTVRSVNVEKAERDALFDGYFCVVTSEMDYGEGKIREVYGGLWRIEQSFRIVKSDLYARPVFVRNNDHIRAHFLICFVSLLILRVIQHRMGEHALSAERIARALNAANCHALKGGIIHLDDVGGAIAFKKRLNKQNKLVDTLKYSDEDEISLDYKRIADLFNTDCYTIYLRQEAFNKTLKNISISL
jgi:transposase